MSAGVRTVDRQCLFGRIPGFGPGFGGRHKPIVLIDVVVRQTAIRQSIVWIDGDGLIEIVDARAKPLFGKFIRVVFALEIKLIGFRIVGRACGQLLLVGCRKLRPQTLRNFPGDVTLHRQQISHLPVVLLAPQLFAVTNIVEFDVNG